MTIDVDAYCRRIGYSGGRTPTLDALRAIHRLHPQAIAFENLSPLLKQPVLLDDEALERKLIHGGRGGYCYEHNLLFGHALTELRFTVRELAGRVLWNVPEGAVLPRTHVLLLIEIDGERHIADVGFGPNTLTGPLLLDQRGEQPTPHGMYRLLEVGDEWILQNKIRGMWTSLYQFDLREQLPPDLEMGNWYTSSHPNSIFVNNLMVARIAPGGRHALRNNELAYHSIEGTTERRTLGTAQELRDVLTRTFGLTLPESGELDALLARFIPA